MLFEPITINQITIRNRVVMPPMCNYTVFKEDGIATEYHLQHYLSRAIGGVGLMIQEATAVTPIGRISQHDLGLWSDAQVQALKPLVQAVKKAGSTMIVQLAHAGRKNQIPNDPIISASAIPFSDRYSTPKEMTITDIKEAKDAFIAATKRALEAGYDGVEIHAAHGYLINTFLSVATNKRTDEYGGSVENRVRFLKEILTDIKAFYPKDKLLVVRVSAEDYAPAGEACMHTEEMIQVLESIKHLIDIVHISSGGVVHSQQIDDYPLYQVNFAKDIKKATGLTTIAVGKITTEEEANFILKTGAADMVAFGRELLRNPYLVAYHTPELIEGYPALKRGFQE